MGITFHEGRPCGHIPRIASPVESLGRIPIQPTLLEDTLQRPVQLSESKNTQLLLVSVIDIDQDSASRLAEQEFEGKIHALAAGADVSPVEFVGFGRFSHGH